MAVIPIILPKDKTEKEFKVSDEAYVGDGQIINSDFLNGLKIEEGKIEVIRRLEKMEQGRGQTIFRLRDWGISRQRYWVALFQFYIEKTVKF